MVPGQWRLAGVAVVLPVSPAQRRRARGQAAGVAVRTFQNNAEAPLIERIHAAKSDETAFIIINPAEPPLIMRDTVHCLTETAPDQAAITASIHAMIREVQKYVPGYRLVNGPVFDGNRVSVYLEVEGLGDYLPKYAGNLDIMTAAAARTAEMFAEEILAGSLTLEPVSA